MVSAGAVDAVGVFVIVAGAILATTRFIVQRRAEFLIAGDIIRTVVVVPTLENIVILG